MNKLKLKSLEDIIDIGYYEKIFDNLDNIKAKPFIKWAGGKKDLLNEINKFYPEDLKKGNFKYCEPFLGGGAVLFDILSNYSVKEIYVCDNNKQLINLYIEIKNNVSDIIKILLEIENEYLKLKQDDRKFYYYQKRDDYNNYILGNNIDKVYGSALFIFLNRTCFNGLYRVNSKGLFNVPIGRYKNPKICDVDNLIKASFLLKNVEFNFGSYTDSLEFIDKNTFVYLDPPYRPLSESASFTSYSKENFNDDDQIMLANFINSINKKDSKFLLSNSDPKNVNEFDDFFDELYSNYNIYRVFTKRRINSRADMRGNITELLISNINLEE